VHSDRYDCALELDAWRLATRPIRVRFDLPYMVGVFDGTRLEVELRTSGAATALGTGLADVEQRVEVVITKAPRGTKLDEFVVGVEHPARKPCA